ncbi:MAG TPA: ATP-binding protein [Rugosimonospora sp.]|nr:ATP-binding protein [Rugosimonospora sp.]
MHRLINRTPLRVKLVVAVLALVAAALLVIGVASAFALRSYLLGQIDAQLRTTASRVNSLNHLINSGELPTSIVVGSQDADGWQVARYTLYYPDENSLPQLPRTFDESAARAGQPYFAPSEDGTRRWRVLIVERSNATMTMVAADTSTMDHAVERLVLAELLVGFGVLILLAVLGAALVRATLGTLREIEHTAQAIAAGDLTRRVPEFEPGDDEPRTEVGRLGRALNAMLVQIEAAFTARAESETAARAAESAARDAESAARDAAEVARLSEARARRSEQRMRQFIADASHELRTPLTTIRGFAELHRQGAVRSPEEVERLVRRIEDEASRMGLLVEDLLLLARLDQERPLERTPLELRVIANDAVAAARVVAPDRPIALEIPEGTGPLVVSGDESRLRQVVGNLMTNALTHTPAGTPVWLRLYGADGDVVVEVADAGPGLSADQAERVFERFYRADPARTRRSGPDGAPRTGAGLGLAIVAALVAAHDGTVEVDSTPGSGATFRVRLPAAPAALVSSGS